MFISMRHSTRYQQCCGSSFEKITPGPYGFRVIIVGQEMLFIGMAFNMLMHYARGNWMALRGD